MSRLETDFLLPWGKKKQLDVGYEWNMNGIWMENEWNMNGIWMEYEWNMNGIWMEYEWNMSGIWVEYERYKCYKNEGYIMGRKSGY